MVDLIGAVWIPTLVSAVLVFLASWLMHALLPHHKSDYAGLPDEDGIVGSLRAAGLKRGMYHFPHMASPDAMKDPAFREACERGPVGVVVVGPNGIINMGRALGQHFVYCLVVSFMVGYVVHATLGPGADYLAVFRIAGAVAWMAYAAAHASASVWFFQPWSVTWKYVLDGLVYALLTAGVFGWLLA